ncbi:MAG: alpha/beta hydrolase [Cyanobacteria bacterium P01_D01_bin.36]
MDFYIWQDRRCVYDAIPGGNSPALLLIHPIGVGLSRAFWHPFIHAWEQAGSPSPIYNLDLLGCGDSEMASQAYAPQDWAEQLAYFVEKIAKGPVVLVVQGALLPVAVRLMEMSVGEQVAGLVLSGPPAWPLMSTQTPSWKVNLAWQLLSSPFGNAFYRYARRESFLKSFSERQLFEKAADVSDDWLKMLHKGSRDMDSRYAVFSFLAGFWRQDYSGAIARIQQPVMIVMGEEASTIDRKVSKQVDTLATSERKRLQDYLDRFPRARGVTIAGRNVLPYESTDEFAQVVNAFVAEI